MGIETAIILSAVAAAGAAEGQRREGVRTQRGAKRSGRQAFRERTAARERLEQQEDTARETGIQRRARARQRSRAGQAQGRSSTILTSPLGTVGESPQASRTLLGQ